MRQKNLFSIIELMTVIFIILLLMSLMVPTYLNIKMNARTSICKNQMRQIGVLMTSYATDNGGYLPADDFSDIPKPAVGNNYFYRHWNGHLLPYMDVNLPDKYNWGAYVQLTGGQAKTIPAPIPVSNTTKGGWMILEDALKNGGYQDLKAFICPEIHANTIDVGAMTTTGVAVPRIGVMCYTYGESGVPTTYLANEVFFGRHQVWTGAKKSYRIDQIAEIDQKAFIVEGGLAVAGGNGESSPPYYMTDTYCAYTGGALIARFQKSDASIHKLSFVHDNYDNFWIMSSTGWSSDFPNGTESFKNDIAYKFNERFKGIASMVLGYSIWSFDSTVGYDIVSYVNPYHNSVSLAGGTIFDNFFKECPPNAKMKPFVPFIDEPNDYKYLVGNMNVLFGDGTVQTKDAAWLCNNRFKISLNSKE